jgi:putative glutamine amidotransferase
MRLICARKFASVIPKQTFNRQAHQFKSFNHEKDWQNATWPYIRGVARRPLILVSPSIEKRGVEFNDLSVSLSIKYENAVLQAGGVPVIVPISTDQKVLAEAVRWVDGVMLTGGDDINPDLYTAKLPRAVHRTVEQTPDGGRRDLFELILLDEVFRQDKPLLAICRGHQLLNIALGGQLIVDLRQQAPEAMNHQKLKKSGELVHEVTLTPGSLLAKIVGSQSLDVNSSHHQAVLEPAEPLRAVARARDGIIEAMELKPEAARQRPFLLSVQFHPERLTDRHANHRAIFRRFVQACVQKHKS